MTVEFPTRTPAAAAQPGFPVYTPDPDRNETPQRPSEAPDPRLAANLPKTAAAASGNPLGDYHKTVQAEPGNEKELLFTIGGVPLYAPNEEDIPPNLPFKVMRDMRRFGPQIAAMNAMAELLGDKALDLLADAPAGSMTKADWETIMEILTEKVFSKFQGMEMPGKG